MDCVIILLTDLKVDVVAMALHKEQGDLIALSFKVISST